MKLRLCKLILATLTASAALAGDLNPPTGPVGPTMKSLAQVEPRTAVNAINTPGDDQAVYCINTPGSYFLTAEVVAPAGKAGIRIAADFVTLELMGFTVYGLPGSLHGISTDESFQYIEIANGRVSNWGGSGLTLIGRNHRIRNVVSVHNGANGIVAGDLAEIEQCTALENAALGIRCISGRIHDCAASLNGGDGISLTVNGAVERSSSGGNEGIGIWVNTQVFVIDCLAAGNHGDGILAGGGCVVRGCIARGNRGDGIESGGSTRVENNTCNQNGSIGTAAGIHVVGDAGHIEGNMVFNNGRGIDVDSTVNLVIRNQARGNTAGNYVIVAGNRVGTIIVPPLAGAINGNSGGGSGTTDPWSNIAY